MAKFGKWIGGGLGWALGGPIGGIVGFAIGSLFDNSGQAEQLKSSSGSKTQPGDFAISLLVLSAAVMKSDGKAMKSELDFIKKFLIAQFGENQAKELLIVLNEIMKKDIPVYDVCIQIRDYMPVSARLQLLHY
jgi:DnaJ like chaperone protein